MLSLLYLKSVHYTVYFNSKAYHLYHHITYILLSNNNEREIRINRFLYYVFSLSYIVVFFFWLGDYDV